MDLYPYQQQGAIWLSTKKRAILGDEPGLGKSAQAIRASRHCWLRDVRLNEVASNPTMLPRVWVICPSSLKYNWQAEVGMWSGDEECQVVTKQNDHLRKTPWTIMSYKIALWKIKHGEWDAPNFVILDEAHKCKNPLTDTARTLLGRESPLKSCPRVWLLTGTPLPNSIIDAYTLNNFCLYGKLGKYYDFAERFAYIRKVPWGNGKQIYGCRRDMLPELANRTRDCMLRRTVEEVLPQLPGYQETIVPLEHTKESRDICERTEVYREAVKEALEEGKHPNIKGGDGNLSSLRMQLGITKIPQAAEFIGNLLEQDLSVVVFAHHRAVIQGLAEKLGVAARVIYGDTKPEIRQQCVQVFQAGELSCLILSIKAAGEGITLTKSRTAVFVEEDWSPGAVEQARKRLHRIGQRSFVNYYYLVYPNSLDSDVHECQSGKDSNIQKFYDIRNGKQTDDTEVEICWDAE